MNRRGNVTATESSTHPAAVITDILKSPNSNESSTEWVQTSMTPKKSTGRNIFLHFVIINIPT